MSALDAKSSWATTLEAQLPPRRLVPYRCEADFYGASDLVAAGLGLSEAPVSQSTWSHGWRFDPLKFPDPFLWDHAEARSGLLVHRQDEQEFLRGEGFANATAVGAPILYAPEGNLPRMERSLLVMPIHSLDYTHHSHEEGVYFAALDAVIGKFDRVAACVHPSCHRRGMWVKGFEERGVPIFLGVEVNDRHGLERMRALLSAFSAMTTNWLGSHVAYAAYCGCSVSIYGPRPRLKRQDYRDDPQFRRNPAWLDWLMDLYEGGHYESIYAQLFRDPTTVSDDRAWAAEMLGEENRRDWMELARLLHWKAEAGESGNIDFDRWASVLGWSSELERRIPEVLESLRSLEKTASAREKQIQKLTAMLENRDERLKKLRTTVDGVREEVADLHRERESLRKQLAVAAQETKSLRDELQTLKDKPLRAVAEKVRKTLGRK